MGECHNPLGLFDRESFWGGDFMKASHLNEVCETLTLTLDRPKFPFTTRASPGAWGVGYLLLGSKIEDSPESLEI